MDSSQPIDPAHLTVIIQASKAFALAGLSIFGCASAVKFRVFNTVFKGTHLPIYGVSTFEASFFDLPRVLRNSPRLLISPVHSCARLGSESLGSPSAACSLHMWCFNGSHQAEPW